MRKVLIFRGERIMSASARPLGIIAAMSEEIRHLGHALVVDD